MIPRRPRSAWSIRLAATQRPGVGWPIAMAALLTGIAAMAAGVIDLTAAGDAAPWLLWIGVLMIGPSLYWLWVRKAELHLRGRGGWASIGAYWLALACFGAVVHLFASAFSMHVLDALFESTSGFATVGMTSISDVDNADRGILAFRAASNWVGGFSALASALVFLPRIRRDGPNVDDEYLRGAGHALIPTVRLGLRNVGVFYGAFTSVGFLAYRIAGLGWFDALAHALSTVSTGGFSTRNGSIWDFTSAPVEWVAIVLMFLAGFSVPAMWWAVRGRGTALLRSVEVQLYLLLILVVTVVASVADTHSTGLRPTREAVMAAVSFLSTTGLVAFDWQGWHVGVQTLLIMLMALGAMNGSAGGGFGLSRAMVLFRLTLRTMYRMLRPHGVRVVKLDKRTIPEEQLRREAGYLVLYAGVALAGAYGVAFFEPQLRRSLVAAVAAISTTGPILGLQTAAELSRGARTALVPVMLLGRSAIVPIALLLSVVTASTRREVQYRLYGRRRRPRALEDVRP
ncbi:MAG: TrkH family potassium uptake protein [Acidimicrobiales bacterium]|nr:TrkH family potassium uptake protein [Acidimicrobiales bacterium]